MKKSQLKHVIKPIVKQCLNELLIEQGLLSNIISEVVKGIQPMHQQPTHQPMPIKEASDPSNGKASALSGIDASDPGVNIDGIMAIANRDWSKMI